MKKIYIIGIIILIGYWIKPVSMPSAVGGGTYCPLPPIVQSDDEPLQTEAPQNLLPFILPKATLKPLAGFSIKGRVLGRKNYFNDAFSSLSKLDLAVGWNNMTKNEVLGKLKTFQSSRFFKYRWDNSPPLPPHEIMISMANMHMIPSSRKIARELTKIKKDDRIRIDGWLVEDNTSNFQWRSSITREDTGGGACEIVYVCQVTRMGRY